MYSFIHFCTQGFLRHVRYKTPSTDRNFANFVILSSSSFDKYGLCPRLHLYRSVHLHTVLKLCFPLSSTPFYSNRTAILCLPLRPSIWVHHMSPAVSIPPLCWWNVTSSFIWDNPCHHTVCIVLLRQCVMFRYCQVYGCQLSTVTLKKTHGRCTSVLRLFSFNSSANTCTCVGAVWWQGTFHLRVKWLPRRGCCYLSPSTSVHLLLLTPCKSDSLIL